MAINWAEYSTVAFIDSNIALEGLALEQLPWTELDRTGPILVLVVPTVMREVDGKKSHQRLGDHARRFNKLMSAFVAGDDTVTVRRSPAPVVRVAPAVLRRFDWAEFPDLDQSEPDARIIAEALTTLGPAAASCLVVSQDIRPLLLAKQHGLRAHHVGPNWLRPKERTDAEKRAALLERELASIKDREPKLEVKISVGEVPRQYRIATLTPQQRQEIQQRILALNPIPQQSQEASAGRIFLSDYDHTLEERYRNYRQKLLPAFMEDYERNLEMNFGQVAVTIHLTNIGQVPANDLRLDVQVSGGWLNDRWVIVGASGPVCPKPKAPTPLSALLHSQMPHITPLHRPRHSVVNETVPSRSDRAAVCCTDFRQGVSHELSLIAWHRPHDDPMCISAVVTASNLHGEVRADATIAVPIEDAQVEDLVDCENMRIKVAFNIMEMLQQAQSRGEWKQFDMSFISAQDR